MRFDGTLTSWNDERGFGYIASTQGGEPIFVHVSAWPKGSGRPQLNQAVSFEIDLGPKGKRAKNVHFIRTRRSAKKSDRADHAQWGGATLFTIPAFLLIYTVVAVVWDIPFWVFGLYVAASIATFVAYAADKSAAANGSWRTPESTLHSLSILGGWPGALVAQQFLRHKSTKQAFRRAFWGTVMLNVIALVVLASPLRQAVFDTLPILAIRSN